MEIPYASLLPHPILFFCVFVPPCSCPRLGGLASMLGRARVRAWACLRLSAEKQRLEPNKKGWFVVGIQDEISIFAYTLLYYNYTFSIMNMENKNGGNGELQIELKEEIGLGTYSNLTVITHSSSEFVLDFVTVLPGMPKAAVQSRIILAPEHAKRLLRALEENISKYEHVFGNIEIPEERPLTFPNVAGEA